MANRKDYGNDSITALKGADRVRLRPGVIFGSDGLEGCEHSIFEILSNSIDEAREGHGDRIEVTRHADRSVTVRDWGRGIPLDYNQREGRYNWELVYCELYAGGKYKNNDGSAGYEYSLGLNGLGCCATQYSSEWFVVESCSGGFKYEMRFERGEPASELAKTKLSGEAARQTGTVQRWLPDRDVFTDTDVPLEWFLETLKKQAVVNAGLSLALHDEESGQGYEFLYPDGIVGYLGETCGEATLTPIQSSETSARGRDREDKPEYRVKIQAAFCFTNDRPFIEYYHNSSFLEHGGSPDKAARSAFAQEIDKCARQRGKYAKDESKVTFADVQDSLALVISSFSTETSYENQTKKAINNRFIQEAASEFLRHWLEVYLIENKAESERIVDQTLLNKRSREQAEKARVNLRKKLGGGVDISNRVKKFVDCRTKDVTRRELYIVEGDSALGSCKLGRDSEFQAIMPLRGKILNCLKADVDSIFRSDVITDLMRVLGCGVEIKSRHAKDLYSFDLAALRWDKVIICTDADVDGFQIRTLVLTMLYRLAPTLIERGKVYIAESPLYEITAKGRTLFAYDEREKAQKLASLGQAKYTVQRSKGLGENDPDMMWSTTMCPETRRLVKVTPSEAEETARWFDLLLGDNLAGRKEFIEKNGHMYVDMADVE